MMNSLTKPKCELTRRVSPKVAGGGAKRNPRLHAFPATSPGRGGRTLLSLLLAVTCLVSAPLAYSATDAPGLSAFDKANALYEANKFDEARHAYDQLVRTGPWSANLFYNRANTEWKLGDAGHAIADYERALTLEPSHPQARANLDYVRDQTGAKTISLQWWERALSAIHPDAAAILLAVCAWVALFSLVAAWTRPAPRTGPIATVAISLLLAAYATGSIREAAGAKSIVIAKSAQARVAPADVAPVADTLPAGSEVRAPEGRGPWTYCTLPDGRSAWVPSDALEKLNPG